MATHPKAIAIKLVKTVTKKIMLHQIDRIHEADRGRSELKYDANRTWGTVRVGMVGGGTRAMVWCEVKFSKLAAHTEEAQTGESSYTSRCPMLSLPVGDNHSEKAFSLPFV